MGSHLSHLAGFGHLTGWPDRPPVMLYGPYIDYISVSFATCSLLAALDYRRHTGKGQYIDIAQLETGLQFLVPVLLDYGVNGREMARNGNRNHYAAPHGAYPCRGEDRWCIIAVFTDEEWKSLCKVMEKPEWIERDEFSTLQARKKHEDELDRLIAEWTVSLTAEEVMESLQNAGVEAAVVKDSRDQFEDPHLQNALWRELEHPEAGQYPTRILPFTLSELPQEIKKPFPANLGEDNHHVYTKILGLSENEYQSLKKDGII
jgi:benzylsuccinate CoA-transferase BbsF subunit